MKNEKKVQYQIYQLKEDTVVTRKIRFMPFEEVKKYNYSIEHIDYDFLYQGMIERKNIDSIDNVLERIYVRFNMEIPKDFYGHSLSVSDIVVVIEGKRKRAYYVDLVGFREIPDFFSRKETELYPYTYKEAIERGEVNVYMYFFRQNKDCASDIKKSINENYHNYALDKKCILPVLKKYGYERVSWILAYNVQQYLHDGRISQENKTWATTSYEQQIYVGEYCINEHPGLINSFLNYIRAINK